MEHVYSAEEAKRRKKHRVTLTLSITGILWCVVAWGISLFLLVTTRRTGFSTIFIFPGMFLSLIASCIGLNKERLHGMAHILPDYAEVNQVPLLIDALYFGDSCSDGKAKLCALLPSYSYSDKPPLDNHQMQRLAKELRQGFKKIIKPKGEKSTESDVAFLVAIVIYFEQELAQGKTVPKSVMPVLQRFTVAPANNHLSSSQWTMLKSVAEEYVAYVGVRR